MNCSIAGKRTSTPALKNGHQAGAGIHIRRAKMILMPILRRPAFTEEKLREAVVVLSTSPQTHIALIFARSWVLRRCAPWISGGTAEYADA